MGDVLRILVRRTRQGGLRWGVGGVDVKQGVADPRAFIVDPTDSVVKVGGSLSLAAETMDLTAHPLPKDPSVFSLRSPVDLRGPLRHPKAHVHHGPIAARVAAAALLAAAGYPHGFKTTLYGYTVEPIPRVLAIVQQQLAEVGIDARLDVGEAVGFSAMASDTSNHIPFGYYAWTADYVDPSNFLDVLLNGRRITPEQNQNLSMLDDPDLNALMERAMATRDDSTRFALWRRADSLEAGLAPIAPLVHQLESRLYSLRLGGWYRHITRIPNLDKLYLKRPIAAPVPRAARNRERPS